MKPQTLAQGAEAIIYKIDNKIVKDRIPKNYRIPEIDNKLRKGRTKSEAKIISKLQKIIPVPRLLAMPGSERMIHMQFIDGEKLSENLENLDYKKISKLIGKNIALMHDNDIIHGDLTTSNMIYVEKEDKVYFIDFGLAFHSAKIEDKAVDLHLLQQALEAKHFTIEKECLKQILVEYEKKSKQGKLVLERIKVIESRGRYKDKY
ncbi:Kae1-associated serine/threonine protein kinase [Candidatus Pacearchaeota archaeon]|nr:Kae1-associated serine/threonine protein kinase [Candidatus Pacearchaeota archaeon]